jgi:FkbM family methyltransferase
MAETALLTIVDGVQIAVPNSLDLITPYVLREQLDFFEDELKFVRTLLRPGQQVIDIGANYGVYTLVMAQKVGAGGHVWAFEPTSGTAKFLAEGISANGFGHVTIVQKAVSNLSGNAQLSIQSHSELNSIIHGQSATGATETVALVTLDECLDRYGWANIELLKIDAEGEEENIVTGGRRFLSDLTPLVQYELRKNAADMNFKLIRAFAAIGYESYRLVPGLNILVPFDEGARPDSYLLNLFCCKVDRAEQLAARGLLLRSTDVSGMNSNSARALIGARYHWRQTLAQRPYAASLSSAWSTSEGLGDGGAISEALSFYACSRDAERVPKERFLGLRHSYSALKAICQLEPTRLRLASLARVAHDYGERETSVMALNRLLAYIRGAGVDTSEVFLAPLERFETISCTDSSRWLVAAVLEQLEQRERFSSFYAGQSALERLEDIRVLGLGSQEMDRRLELVRRRFAPTPR